MNEFQHLNTFTQTTVKVQVLTKLKENNKLTILSDTIQTGYYFHT